LRERLAARDGTRLVVAPILEPSEQLRDHQASVDVRLGSRFYVAEPTAEAVIDTVERPDRRIRKTLIFIPFGKGIVLHPHQLLLGETLEFVRLPRDLMAYVVGRSSWGRDGLIVATAVGIHPGFGGPITLELRNLGEVSVRLYPGDPIAQLFFHYVDISAAAATAPPSQFAGAGGPRPGVHRYRLTEQKLRAAMNREALASQTDTPVPDPSRHR
jgi:dCTP deaminase